MPNRMFINPRKIAGQEIVWRVGEEHELEWACDFNAINIRLWQEDPGRESALFFDTVFQSDFVGQPELLPTRSTWKVDIYNSDPNRSNLYFLWAWNTTNATEQETMNLPGLNAALIERFGSPKFIILPAQESSSSNTSSVATSTSTATSSATTSSSTTTALAPTYAPQSSSDASTNVAKIVVLSILVPLLLLGVLAWFWWRWRKRNKKPQHGHLSTEASQNAEKPWDGKVVEIPAEERPVEVAGAELKSATKPPVVELG